MVHRGRVLTAPAQLAGYDADALGYKTFTPDAVVIPADADELKALLTASRSLNVPVTIRGAGTSLSGGPVAAQGGVVVHTSSLKKVRTISHEGFWCEVECSVTLNQLDMALKPYGMFYPPDPSSGPVCTIGGNVAMNAGGAHCFRYGVTSNYVLGLEVVLLDGSVHRFGGPAGGRGDWRADWKRLMVGSEGTLGAFTRFWLRTLPRAEKAWTFRSTFPDLRSAEQAIHALVAHSSFPVAIELMDPRCVAMVENSPMAVGLPKDAFLLVTEIEGPAILVDARVQSVSDVLTTAGALKVEFSDDEIQRAKLWKARKVAGGLMGQLSPDFLVQDAVIPKRALADVLQLVYDEADAAALPVVNVFHAGDGNLHPNFMFNSRKPGELERVEAISKRLMQRVVQVGGTLSGEHGIGNDKTAYMPMVFGPETLRLQMAVPAVFNADHQLNPMKVFSDRRFSGLISENALNASTDQSSAQTSGSHPSDLSNANVSRSSSGITNSPTAERRLFQPFLDTIDAVMCVPASITADELTAQISPHHLRFPLMVDANVSLCQQVAAVEYASASSRFGPLCDNIIGMNWQLPNGRTVRIGERVVKSTTGYDLLRFLLQSLTSHVSSHADLSSAPSTAMARSEFGQPIDFVLRLRPDCGLHRIVNLQADGHTVEAAVLVLQQSCWMNWFDSVDVIADAQSPALTIRLAINTPAIEWQVFESMLETFAANQQLSMSVNGHKTTTLDGCPDLVLKTTADRTVSLARMIANQHSIRCLALCYNGVVHAYLPAETNAADSVDLIRTIVNQCQVQLSDTGGDWRSRHLHCQQPCNAESSWLQLLAREFEFS